MARHLSRTCAVLVAALCLLAVALPSHARGEEPRETTRVRLPINEAGEVKAQDLLRLVLHELGSEVDIPDGVVDGTIPIDTLEGQLIVFGLDKLMRDQGLGLEITDGALILELDQAKLAEHVDALEDALRDSMGGDRPRVLLTRITEGKTRGPPVVLVHGLDASAKRLIPAASALSKAGYDVYIFSYPNDGRVLTSAKALGEKLRALSKARGRPVSLVTVSMGGLVALAAVELDEAYGGEVERIIACAPPFGGAPMARYQLFTETIDTVRGLLEDEHKGLLVFDGLGQASSDLRPGSRLLRRLSASKRRDDVTISVIAGKGEVVPDESLAALEIALRVARPETQAADRLTLDLILEATLTARAASGGRGDGAVPLSSQSLHGVSDRVVTPLNHLQFLKADPETGTIGALDEVLKRLPPTRGRTGRR